MKFPGRKCGPVLQGWWPCRAFWGLQHNQWDQISLHSTGSGNDYLELTQIKDFFILSQKDLSKTAAPCLKKQHCRPVLLTACFCQSNPLKPEREAANRYIIYYTRNCTSRVLSLMMLNTKRIIPQQTKENPNTCAIKSESHNHFETAWNIWRQLL